ncbi:transcriptional regulator FtrA [Rugamonas aquatica]|uniref:Transcriptional regulator FtrA n=1 Tax=Rugamonas aquatica TaxID=2743357 RepID=A0A6A7N4V5_9BURK|nr:transcriptional regulator FtrA [Rugamonas aquatica]MQA39938.1 transcriptional regulator FtrA [Rugamonas aquatica]
MDDDLKKNQLVVALAYDRLGTFEFGCVTEIFALPRPELDVDWYRFEVCSAERGMLRSSGGMQFAAPHTLDMLDQADTIIIPGWRDPDEAPPAALLDKLRAAHARGARLCSICSGAFVLAWAGLLDGRRATTHWRLAEKLKRRFPAIEIEPNALYVDEGQILTSAGSAAGLDLMLYLVAMDYGHGVAARVAQRLIVQPHRDGAQAQRGRRPVHSHRHGDERGRLDKLIEELKDNLNQPHTLATLAREAAMSPRTLQRQFHETTGLSPYEWLLRERVSLAKQMLETPRATLAHICERAGFCSEESFRHHFRRLAGVSPSGYRRAFRAAG